MTRAPSSPPGCLSGPALNIGFLCSEYPSLQPVHGGIGSFVQTIAAALVERGHRVTVYGFAAQDATFVDNGVTVVAVRRHGVLPSIRSMAARIRHDLRSGRIDIAESAESEAHCLPGGVRTVVRLHGSHHFWCATLPQKKRYMRLMLEQIAIRRAGGLCAVSQFAAEVTRRSMHLGRRPIDVLSNPVDTTTFVPRPATVVRNRVLFAGSITEKKGVRELCRAMTRIARDRPDAELHLVGRDVPRADGSLLRDEIAHTLSPAERARIRFLGPRPRADVSRMMAAAHVCAFPSHMETQGIVVLEAMACGRPVIASRLGPGPEVVGTEGESGFLVDPGQSDAIADAVIRILADDALSARLGAHGRRRAVDHFSLPVCIDRNLDFYRRLCGAPEPS